MEILSEEEKEVLRIIYLSGKTQPRDYVKEEIGIENPKKVEREAIKKLLQHYLGEER